MFWIRQVKLPADEHTSVFESNLCDHHFDLFDAISVALLFKPIFQAPIVARTEPKVGGFAHSNNLIWISLDVFGSNRAGPKMQWLADPRPVITRRPGEKQVNRYRGHGLIVVVKNGDFEAVEPVVVFTKGFVYFNVSLFLRFGGDYFHWLNAPGLPGYNPSLLLTLGKAVVGIHRLPG